MKTLIYPVMVECMEEGGYYAECPVLPGCHVEGETYTEAIENLEDAINIFIKSYKDLGKALPDIPIVEGCVVVSSSIPVPFAV
jgi:predicted RNase H-like HicB family nuclease